MSSESNFGGIRVADRVWKIVPGGWTSNVKSPVSVGSWISGPAE